MNDFVQFFINQGYSEQEAKQLYKQFLKQNSATVSQAKPQEYHNPYKIPIEQKKRQDRFHKNKSAQADALTFGMTPHKNQTAANVGAENIAENLLWTIPLEGLNAGVVRPIIKAFNNSAFGTLWNMAHNRVPLHFNNTVKPKVISYVPSRIKLNQGSVNLQEPSYNMIRLSKEEIDELMSSINTENISIPSRVTTKPRRRPTPPKVIPEITQPSVEPMEGQTVMSILNDALAYWTSPERQALNEQLKQEAYAQGFLSNAPVENLWEDGSQYALWLNRELPSVELNQYLAPKGKYNPNLNAIELKSLNPYTIYHEGIHAYGAVDPSRALFSPYFKPSFPYQSVVNTARFRQSKVNSILKPEFQYDPNKQVSEQLGMFPSRKVRYNSDPDELVAYGLTAGRRLKIKPFEPFVSAEHAEQQWAEAVKQVPFLNVVREDIPSEQKWKILNGTFLSTLPFAPALINSVNENK